MESIERISVIDRRILSEEFYMQSLLEEAARCHLLMDADIENIQFGCLELLAYKVERYNGCDSQSIRVEVAENIMKSNLFTIGLHLKSYPSADDAVKALKETALLDLYHLGMKRLEAKRNAAKHLHMLVMQNKLDTENYTYNSTVTDGIKGFFKIYDPEYTAHEIHITADYPLCHPIEDLAGIEFIQKYLESIYYENLFCRCFSSEDIHHLLCGYDADYSDLILNIFEQVLTTALGCKLIGVPAKT